MQCGDKGRFDVNDLAFLNILVRYQSTTHNRCAVLRLACWQFSNLNMSLLGRELVIEFVLAFGLLNALRVSHNVHYPSYSSNLSTSNDMMLMSRLNTV